MDARRRQVSINVKVVDIQLDDSQEFGVGWSTGNTDGFISTYNPLFPIESAGSAFLRFGQAAGQFYPQYFQAQIDAVIRNKNAKVLTDPTLVVQEGQLANVALVQSVLTGQTVSYENTGTGANAGTVAVITPTFEYVGLTLGINVEGIDDNGFISFVVKPTISAPSGTVNFNSGGIVSNTNTFTLITKREVSSGLIRVRDGQTLILSGIISETDKVDTQKVPILGDIPFLGVLFRKQLDSTQRSEVVVILTPRIINDEPSVNFGSNYTPTKEALELLRQNNFPVQVLP
jgi:type IV pilus assembly protein PilQ